MTPRAAACLILAVATAAGEALAQGEPIGTAARVEVWAYRTPTEATDRRDLFANDRVFLLDRITTVDRGGAQIRFVDDTSLTIGRGSEILLDSFVFDPAGGSGAFIANVGRGAFRFVSGSIPNQSFRIETPTATIGIRGTVFDLVVTAVETRVDVIEGLVEVTPGCNPDPFPISAGQSVRFLSQTCETVIGVASPIDALEDISEDAFPGQGPGGDFGDDPVPQPPSESEGENPG